VDGSRDSKGIPLAILDRDVSVSMSPNIKQSTDIIKPIGLVRIAPEAYIKDPESGVRNRMFDIFLSLTSNS
jgi:hypothetical protein